MSQAFADGSRMTIHGVALALGETGLLVRGESGAGKSMLAARVLAGWPHGPARLVADDRVILERRGDRIVARPHARIAGLLECRGLGIVGPPSLDAVVIRIVLTLTADPIERLPAPVSEHISLLDVMLPHRSLPADGSAAERLFAFWPYFSGLSGPFSSNMSQDP